MGLNLNPFKHLILTGMQSPRRPAERLQAVVRAAVVLCLHIIFNCKTKVGREALNDVKITLFELMCQP